MKKPLLVLALVTVTAAPEALAQKGGDPGAGPCIQTVVKNAMPSHSMRIPPALSALKELDADVVVRVPSGFDLSQPQPIELRFLAPSGSLYQSMTVVASSGSAGPSSPVPATLKVSGYPEPLRVQRANVAADGVLEVRAALPVAGTHIVRNSLYGTWAIKVFFGGKDATCPRDIGFRIVP